MSVRLRFMLAALAMINRGLGGTNAAAAPPGPAACIAHVPEAARRSGVSEEIVMRVMLAESGGNPRIVSPAGAMGCMQIMPATWAYLSPRYNLGADPFDARRNMIGGAMYLAELVARYGMTGALAAYNAGPGRYERYAAGTATLPAETIAYTSRIGATTGASFARTSSARWQEAGLFLTRGAPPAMVDALPQAPDVERGNRMFPLAPSARYGTADPAGP